MPTVQILCHACGSQAEMNVGESELARLRGEGGLERYCGPCRGTTRWGVADAKHAAHPGLANQSAPGRPKILIIDDDPDLLNILDRTLGGEAFDVELAKSGREAVRLLARADYDLILSDIRMPELDGKQLFEFLDKNLPEYRHRVVFLTGDTGNPETMEFLKSTNRPFLAKPVDLPSLQVVLRKFLGAK